MSESDCAAVGVQLLVNINAEISANCDRLCSKCFVSLDDIEVFDLHANLVHYLLCGVNRSDTHNLGTAACKTACYEGSHRLHAKLLSLLLAHHNDSSSAIIDTGSVSCGYETILVDGTQLGKCFHGGAGTGSLINLELNHFLLFLYHYRYDFLLKSTVLLCFLRLQLALQRELIQLFSCDAPLTADIVCGGNHVIVVECIPESIVYHGIYQSTIVHSVSETALHHSVRSHGHVLHTACYNDVGISCHDHLCSLIYAVQTGTAYNVHCYSGYFNGKTCLDGCLTGHVLSLTCLNNATHVYLVNLLRLNTCSVQRFLDNDCTQLRCGGSAQ